MDSGAGSGAQLSGGGEDQFEALCVRASVVNFSCSRDWETPRKVRQHVRYLLAAAGSGSLNARTAGGMTPLMLAVNEDNYGCVSELLQLGADVNAVNPQVCDIKRVRAYSARIRV